MLAIGQLIVGVPTSCKPPVLLAAAYFFIDFVYAPVGGFIKTVIRVLRCVGHYNSKILLDKVRQQLLSHVG
jgi:hypothetical protein